MTPRPGIEHYRWVAGRDGKSAPELFDEFTAPGVGQRGHTATLCGEVLYVLGGTDARGALQVAMLDTRTFSWHPPLADSLSDNAPRTSGGIA